MASWAWSALDAGRVTATKPIADAGLSPGQGLSCRRVAMGVWRLTAAPTSKPSASVDATGRRLALAASWLRSQGLAQTGGLLVGAPAAGGSLLVVDVAAARFKKGPT